MTTPTDAACPPMDLPIIDLDAYIASPRTASSSAQCAAAAAALIRYGAVLLHTASPALGGAAADSDAFLDLLEDYFAQPDAALRRDERPRLGYQVGATLANTERPACGADEACRALVRRLEPEQRPLGVVVDGGGGERRADPKCRFFWRMADDDDGEEDGKGGGRARETAFPTLNAPNVVPEAPEFRERWAPIMDRWGKCMKNAVSKLSEMVAIGLDLEPTFFTDAARHGPHLLAPTASDLTRYGDRNTVLAGFHADLNFLTIHGRSRYPGLHIWARNTGRRIPVRMPSSSSGDGGNYLLVQAGKQLEHLSGGLIRAGYHEVVVTDATVETVERRRRLLPDRPSIRISSTLFWHLASDFDLVPVPSLVRRAQELRAEREGQGLDEGPLTEYPPIKVGHQVENELKKIELMT